MRIVSLVMDDKLLDVARQKQANQEQSKFSSVKWLILSITWANKLDNHSA